jgi:hypothetical protein
VDVGDALEVFLVEKECSVDGVWFDDVVSRLVFVILCVVESVIASAVLADSVDLVVECVVVSALLVDSIDLVVECVVVSAVVIDPVIVAPIVVSVLVPIDVSLSDVAVMTLVLVVISSVVEAVEEEFTEEEGLEVAEVSGGLAEVVGSRTAVSTSASTTTSATSSIPRASTDGMWKLYKPSKIYINTRSGSQCRKYIIR